ncbi:MAG: lactonase family protein [Bacteroidales bacterium]|nr:lactonase family protein [Bacteroidales bacterium]
MKNVLIAIVLSIIFLTGCKDRQNDVPKEIIYVGTFTERNSQGLYVFEFVRDSLQFKLLQQIPELESPSFLEIHPSHRYLYVVSRHPAGEKKEWGSVQSFVIDSLTGKLIPVNEKPSYGKGPCHISIDQSGKFVFVSNYNEGSLVVYGVNHDGSLTDSLQTIQHLGRSLNENRQEGPHVHSALISPDNRFLYVADLGIDKIMIYSFDARSGYLAPASSPYTMVQPGAGPRHFNFHPAKNVLYLAEELSSTTSVFLRDTSSGALTEIQRITSIPDNCDTTNTNADIHTDATGKFLYVSNRGHNSLAVYAINPESGLLTLAGYQSTYGDHPRNFLVDDSDSLLFVANRFTDNINLFKLNDNTGMPEFTGVTLTVPGAVCLKMLKL